MSTDAPEVGGKQAAEAMVAESHAQLPAPVRQVQCDLLDVPSPEEMARSRKELHAGGGDFDELDVLDHAREKRKASAGGRKPGSKNKRTRDFEKYILQNGNRDPALILAEIASTPPEVLVQRSSVMDPAKKQLTYGAAQALRTRAAEGLMPYMHGKKPVCAQRQPGKCRGAREHGCDRAARAQHRAQGFPCRADDQAAPGDPSGSVALWHRYRRCPPQGTGRGRQRPCDRSARRARTDRRPGSARALFERRRPAPGDRGRCASRARPAAGGAFGKPAGAGAQQGADG